MAEPIVVVESREHLWYLLTEASQVEHMIMCQYLYATFSLKGGVNEDLTDAQAAAVGRWRGRLHDIAVDEMLHLALVANVMAAIGAAPTVGRPNFPQRSGYFPPSVQLDLLPFGEAALTHFLYLERPEGMERVDAEGFVPMAPPHEPLSPDELLPRVQDFATVGHLYRGIANGLSHLVERFGERAVFVGAKQAQTRPDLLHWPELIAVTDLASAGRAIETIVEQGDGARGDWIRSHFGTFVGILEDLLAEQAADPAFNPARPVEPAFVRLPPDVDAGTLIEDRTTAQVADLANGVYEVVLQVLSRYYIHHGETAAEFDTLARTAKHLMNWVMRALGPVLTTLPVGPSHPGRTAGPAFDIARPAIFLLPHQDAAWKIIKERLDALQGACASLGEQAGLGALAPLADKLEAMSQDIGKHASTTGH